jgi:hypothetical protein
MIQVLLLVVLVVLSLLPFFKFFRGSPHQLAAVKQLEESVPKELLEEDAAWFEAWKASGIDQEVRVPYFSQLDNISGYGGRECFSSAAAMVAAYWGKVSTDDEYNRIRARFGDTTSIQAQIKTLESLGLEVEFRRDGDATLVEMEIEMGRPVMVGWLHKGDISGGKQPLCNGSSCGHWSVISGYAGRHSNDPEWIMQDPRGLPDLIKGGHVSTEWGKDARIRQAEFSPRWEVEGKQTGWVILVDGG